MLDDFVAEDNSIRVVDEFVDELDLSTLGFNNVTPASTGRPVLSFRVNVEDLLCGYLNRVPSSLRLERECPRNPELMSLTGRLAPDVKTIADFRRDNGQALRNSCRQFVVLCLQLNFFADAVVAIDRSKFKAVNAHDSNFTWGKLE